MLVRSVFDNIKSVFEAALEASITSGEEKLIKFLQLPLDEQLGIIHTMINEAVTNYPLQAMTEGEIKAFLLLLAMQAQSIVPNSAQHYELREKLGLPVRGWLKANPPATMRELIDTGRNPSWDDEYRKIGEMVNKLDFTSAHNDNDIADAVKTVLEIGGLEDNGDSRAIDIAKDLTMRTFIAAVKHHLPMARPDWATTEFQLVATLDQLGKDADPHSADYITKHNEGVHKANKRAAAYAAASVAREKRKLERNNRKIAFWEKIASNTKITSLITSLAETDFQDVKGLINSTQDGHYWAGDDVLAELTPYLQLVGKDEDERQLITSEAMEFTQEYMLSELAKQQPTWITVMRGKLCIRDEPEEVGVTSKEKKCMLVVAKLAQVCGTLEVAKATLAVLGIDKPVHEVFGALRLEPAILPPEKSVRIRLPKK